MRKVFERPEKGVENLHEDVQISCRSLYPSGCFVWGKPKNVNNNNAL